MSCRIDYVPIIIKGIGRLRRQRVLRWQKVIVGKVGAMSPGSAEVMDQTFFLCFQKTETIEFTSSAKKHLTNTSKKRKKTDFKKGDIAYFPTGGCICFFLNDVLDGQPMTPIGKLLSSIENLKDVKTGDILTLYSETV